MLGGAEVLVAQGSRFGDVSVIWQRDACCVDSLSA